MRLKGERPRLRAQLLTLVPGSTTLRHVSGRMSGVIEDIDYYAVLDVKEDATAQEIKSGYRQRSLKGAPLRLPRPFMIAAS